MPRQTGVINLNIKTNLDLKGVEKLKRELDDLQKYHINIITDETNVRVNQLVTSVNAVKKALTQSYDFKLNNINVEKFNRSLRQSNTSLAEVSRNLVNSGVEGQKAFLNLTNQLVHMGTAIKQSHKFLDEIATTMSNTIKWGISSSTWNAMVGSFEKAYFFAKDLDRSLNDIRIVTGKSNEEMRQFAVEANRAAQSLAVSTKDYVEGSLIYYQQGLDDRTVSKLTEITAKTANVTGQSMSTVSEYLTAVWNGYKAANEAAVEGMDVYERYVDKLAAVGANTASDLEELSVAMSKVASAAASMGVDFDDLNAQIATIVSVTRQAPESVGTALKTVYARLGDLKVDGVDEFGVKLGDVTKQLQKMGINILDQQGNMRDMSDVIKDVSVQWQAWGSAQREAAAIAMAGKRLDNLALFRSDTILIAA